MLVAALRQAREENPADSESETHLLLYELDRNPELEDWMSRLSLSLGSWCQIHWSRDILKLAPPDDVWPIPLASESAKLRRSLGLEHADELWVGHLHAYAERLVLETFPEAVVFLFEEGLDPYCLKVVRSWRTINFWGLLKSLPALLWTGKLAAHLTSLRLCDWRISRRYLRRVKIMYLFLLGTFPGLQCRYPCRVRSIAPASLKSIIDEARKVDPIKQVLADILPVPRKTVLLLSSFVIFDTLTRDDALDALAEVVTILFAKGYSVHFKTHPRGDSRFQADLHKRIGDGPFQQFEGSSALPIELLASCLNYCAYVGATSSCLFYLSALYGSRVYSIARFLLPRLKKVGPMDDYDLAARVFPGIESMPDANMVPFPVSEATT